MALIQTTEEIKQFLLTDASFDPKSILPFIPLAEKEVLRVLGQIQYDELHDYYIGGGGGIPELDELLPMVQRPLVFFAFLQGMDILNVVITNTGIGVVSTTNLAPASEKRTIALKENILDNAWGNMEALLEFLELHLEAYTNWSKSSAFAYQYEYLISSALKFNEFIPIERSRIAFLQLRPVMADVELLIMSPVVSAKLLDEIKDQISYGNVTTLNAVILPYLQRALAYYTYGEVYKSQTHNSKAVAFLMEAKKILDLSPDDYPLYRDSDSYISDLENYQTYENDEEINIVVF